MKKITKVRVEEINDKLSGRLAVRQAKRKEIILLILGAIAFIIAYLIVSGLDYGNLVR